MRHQYQVGHADPKMTMDVYPQLEQRVDRSHGESFDRLVRKEMRDGAFPAQKVFQEISTQKNP
jgi:hypothetical protein